MKHAWGTPWRILLRMYMNNCFIWAEFLYSRDLKPYLDSFQFQAIDRITNKQSVTLFCVFVYDFCVYCWHSVFTNKAIVFWSVSSKDSNDVTDLDSSFQIKILRKKCSKHAGDLMKINRLQIISCNVFIDLRIHKPYLDG